MTFADIAQTMLSSMDFFELRKTAAKYAVPYQGVRRQHLIREIQMRMLEKANRAMAANQTKAADTQATASPVGAVSARPKLNAQTEKKVSSTINNFSSRAGFTRVQTR